MDEDAIRAMRNGEGLDNEGKYWTDEDRKQLEHDYYEGIGFSIIAFNLKRSEGAVFQQASKMKLTAAGTKRRNRTCYKEFGCLCPNCNNYNSCPSRDNSDTKENNTNVR